MLRVAALDGSQSPAQEMDLLEEGPDIIVATPGRLVRAAERLAKRTRQRKTKGRMLSVGPDPLTRRG